LCLTAYFETKSIDHFEQKMLEKVQGI